MSDDLELEKAKAMALAEADGIGFEKEEKSSDKKYEPTPGPVEAFTRSAAQTMMFDFADEAEAAFDTGLDALTDDDIELSDWKTLSETYGNNLQIAREEYQANKDAHPTADKLGLAAGIGASILTGSATAKGIAKVAPNVMKGFNALSTTQKAARLGAFQGALSSVGMSDEKMSLEAVLRAAGGATLGAVMGAGASKFAESKTMGHITDWVSEKAQQSKMLTNMALRGIGLGNNRRRNKFFKTLERKGVKPEKWLDDISKEKMVDVDDMGNYIEGDSMLNDITASYDELYSRADDKIQWYAQQRDSILSRSSKKIDRVGLANRLKSKVAKDISPEQASSVNNAIDNLILYKTDFDPKTGQLVTAIQDADLDLLGVSQLRKSLDDVINFNSVTNANKVKRSMRDALNDYTDSAAEALLTDADKLSNRALRKKMSNLYSLQEALEQGANESMMSSASLFHDFVATKFAKQATQMVTGKAGGEGIQAMAVAMRRMTVSSRMNRKTAMMAHQLADSLPQASEKALRRLMVAANGEDVNVFNDAAASLISDVELRKMPLSRSSEDTIRRKDTILPLVQSVSPELASGLRSAIDDGDMAAVASTMDALSKHPDAKGLIEQGIGWDGKVYSEEDKAALEQEIRRAELPIAQEIVLLEELNQQGKIPNIEPVETLNRKFIPRDKSKHSY